MDDVVGEPLILGLHPRRRRQQDRFLRLKDAQNEDPPPSSNDIVDARAPDKNDLLPAPVQQDLLQLLFTAAVVYAAK